VGDFLNITINTTAQTISYTNFSNGDSGTIPYTVNGNGSYALTDPRGNFISAYEVPGYALVIQAAKAGPDHNTPALITAVESGPISLSTFGSHSYNYMQFRTSAGGLEVGSVTIDPVTAGTTIAHNTSYWPYGDISGDPDGAFHNSTLDFSGTHEAASGTYLSGPDGGGGNGTDYIFGTSGGFFIVDMQNGSLLGLQKAATKAFDPSVAGTYSAIYYQKENASTGVGNVETGTPSLGQATIVIGTNASITVNDSQGGTVVSATLTPVADAAYLYGTNELADPCNGLFTFRTQNGNNSQQVVFVTFVNNAVVFSSFTSDLPWLNGSHTYTYQYGVGLK
jgi:hypothetical protein